MRGRSYSYSPSPPRGYGRRGRSPSPVGRYGGRGRDASTSLLVRNLHHDCRPEDLRRPFGQFGPLKDIYLPKDYYTGEPRGFGFVQYVDPADAAEAKYQMDGQIFRGRELTVVFAEENRKRPADMRARERSPSPGRYSPPRRRRSRSCSRSFSYYSPPRHGNYSRYISYLPNKCASHSLKNSCMGEALSFVWHRSVSPEYRRSYRDRSYSRSPYSGSRSQSPSVDYDRRRHRERSVSVSY
ncbi:Serine/arginine-rich splicing factor 33 [Acorus calamus]|uniref:Serine/arginine-rich splicing factor 33 n=1 Tax=Acorus calamus TaxID=4465 RepID=A0AAV9C094_ACOCL|nr:Serine/arginine-rich splicing factor 33 [Acorus calamus]